MGSPSDLGPSEKQPWTPAPTGAAAAPRDDRWLTLPNALCLFRLLAAPFLVLLASREQRYGVLALFLLMTLSDWLDGKVAILLDQRSRIGPILDSVADVTMYVALAAGTFLLEPDILQREGLWLSLPLATYVVAGLASLYRFRRWPSHHTRTAKMSWLLILIGAVALLLRGTTMPLRIGMLGATLANLQSLAITFLLDRFTTDVPSIAAALRLRQRQRASGA